MEKINGSINLKNILCSILDKASIMMLYKWVGLR